MEGAVIQSPGNYEPELFEERLMERWNYVLDGMVEKEWLTPAERAEVKFPKFKKQEKGNQLAGQTGYILETVKQELVDKGWSEAEIDGGGLTITTTIKQQAQDAAVAAVENAGPTYDVDGLRVGLIAVEPDTRRIAAMYGGRNYLKNDLNTATQGHAEGGSARRRERPLAQDLGAVLTLHPDDPPRPLFGLPRVASTEADYAALFEAVPSPANGICVCAGSLGVRGDNDLPAMARRLGPRIGFAHLRSTRREADGLSFHETDHLDGDFDMVAVLGALIAENRKRSPGQAIVFRPDHGQRMLDDLRKPVNPGYAAIGRLKGLAELRGAIRVLEG